MVQAIPSTIIHPKYVGNKSSLAIQVGQVLDLGVSAALDSLAEPGEVSTCTELMTFASKLRKIAEQPSGEYSRTCVFLGLGCGLCQVLTALRYLAAETVQHPVIGRDAVLTRHA